MANLFNKKRRFIIFKNKSCNKISKWEYLFVEYLRWNKYQFNLYGMIRQYKSNVFIRS